MKGNINSTVTVTLAGVLYSLKALLDPDVPNNQGLIEIVDIIAPLGTLINSRFPAAVAARANTAQRIVDVVIGALAPAIPEAAVGAANGANTTAVFFGHDPRHDRDYVYLETLGGGFGGRFTKDGKDGVQVHITNTSNLPVESIEMEYPLLVESYGFVEDSGGAGKHRGGLGLRRVVRPVGHTMTFSGQGERFVNRPWGLFGGGSGGTGKFVKLTGGAEVPLPTKPANLEVKAERGDRGRDAGRGRLRQAGASATRPRSRTISCRASFQPRLHQGALRRRAEGQAMSYDAIVVGAGISGAATAYHLRKAGAKTLLIERGEPASGGTGKSAAIIRQSYSTPLLVRLARASITMFENAKAELGKDAGFVQDGYCFVVSRRHAGGREEERRDAEGPRHRQRMVRGPGLSAASARDQSRRHRRHRVRAAWRLRRSGAGDRGLCRRRSRSIGGEFRARTPVRRLLRAGRPHHRRRARQRRGRAPSTS